MTHSDYWRKREQDALLLYQKQEAEFDKEIERIYRAELDAIQREIEAFFGRYADKEGITISEAKKRVSKLDIEAYERKAERYVREKNFSAQANAEMRLYNATMRINRLEMLKANIGLELVSGHDELEKYLGSVLQGRTMAELERQAGILGKTVKNNAELARTIPNASFHNATFSDRVWANQALLRAELSKLLQTGMIQGKNPRVLAGELKKALGTSTYNAERLMRTELARVQTAAQEQSFKANGFDEYEFISNSGCCESCQELDGKHFKVKDMMSGENAAPLHPHCRCSCAAYEDSAEYEAWLDYLDKGGTTELTESHENSGGRLKNPKNSSIIISGGISGTRNPASDEAAEHAERYYRLVRSMTTDVSRIANTIGLSENEVQAIKNFIFLEKHDLGGSEPEYFDADYMMAESWQRLINGNPEPHDLILIKHEQSEQQLMEQGMSQHEAHIIASKKYNYEEEAKKFYGKIKKFRK